jgi:hypothetical protein
LSTPGIFKAYCLDRDWRGEHIDGPPMRRQFLLSASWTNSYLMP